MSKNRIDIDDVIASGRKPVLEQQVHLWTLSVYRIGRTHEYVGVATTGVEGMTRIHTDRISGPGAMVKAMVELENRISQPIEWVYPS